MFFIHTVFKPQHAQDLILIPSRHHVDQAFGRLFFILLWFHFHYTTLTLPYLSALSGDPLVSRPGWASVGQEDQEAPGVQEDLEDQAGHAKKI